MFNIFGSKNNNNLDDIAVSNANIEETSQKYKINHLKQLDDKAILAYLKKEWDISQNDSISVWGKLRKVNDFIYQLTDVKKINGSSLEYPIEDLEKNLMLSNSNINISTLGHDVKKLYDARIIYVSCDLNLEVVSKRTKNPLLLKADPKTLKPLQVVPVCNFIKIDDALLIEKAILDHCAIVKSEEIQNIITEQLEEHEKERDNIKSNLLELSVEHSNKEKTIQNQEVKLGKLQTEIGIKQEGARLV